MAVRPVPAQTQSGIDTATLNRALCQAADEGDAESVERLLKQGADAWATVERGNALIHALWYGANPSVVEQHLRAGAPPTSCSKQGCPAVVVAARYGPLEVLVALLDAGADIEAVDPSTGDRPLHAAAGAGDLPRVKLLLKRGAKVDARKRRRRTALHDIAESYPHDPVDIAKALLVGGARLDLSDSSGQTPLWLALKKGTADKLIGFLLKKGADGSRVVKGRTLLMIACDPCGRERHVKALVKAGADTEARYADNGDTMLMRACRVDAYFAIEPLIAAGADVHATNEAGDTVLSLARAHCSPHWVTLLEAAVGG